MNKRELKNLIKGLIEESLLDRAQLSIQNWSGILKPGTAFSLVPLDFHNKYGTYDEFYDLISKQFGENTIVEYKPMKNILKYEDNTGKTITEKADAFFKTLAKSNGRKFVDGEFVLDVFPKDFVKDASYWKNIKE